MIDISEDAVKKLCTALHVYGNEYANETIYKLTALRQALTDQETRNSAQLHHNNTILTARNEAVSELSQRNNELTAMLAAMCEEFRALDLPYGSIAYSSAVSLLNGTAAYTPQRSQDDVIARLKAALQPFAEFALDNIANDAWANNTHRESISTWFGPSDFVAALRALDQYAWDIPLEPCPFCASSDLAVMRSGNAEYYVHCENCEASATVTQWNNRTTKKG